MGARAVHGAEPLACLGLHDALTGADSIAYLSAGNLGAQRDHAANRPRCVEFVVAGRVPRELRALACVGHMEREPGRLQLRFVLRGDEHVDDIVVAEDDQSVVVFATVCASTAGPGDDAMEGPWHVYLDKPLGEGVVIDASSGEPVPYKNVCPEPFSLGRSARAKT